MTSVVVRRAVLADADALGSVHVRAWQAAYRGLMPDEFLDALSIEERQRSWRDGLAPGRLADRDVLVVEDPVSSRVCGFAAVGDARDDDADGELWAINVDPDAWGRGVSAPLQDGAVRAHAERGCSGAYLWVVAGTVRARRFYEREGWTSDGGVKDGATFGGRPVRQVRYRRALASPPARD